MSNSKYCQREGLFIQIKNYCRPFFPGEEICGHVHLFLSVQKEFKYLCLKLEGKAEVHWTRRVSRKSNSRGAKIHKTTHYRNIERYFFHKEKLMGNDREPGEVVTFPSGHSSYPFSFTLPPDLPPSYRSLDNIGKITYQITAQLKKTWCQFDIFVTIPFQVNGVATVNPEMREMYCFEKIASSCFHCFYWNVSNAVIKFSLPKRVFVPGEVISLFITLNDDSTRNFAHIAFTKKLLLTLMQLVTYKTRRHKKTAEFEINKSNGNDSCAENEKLLQIPINIPISNLGGNCKIIDLQYYLKIEVENSALFGKWKSPIEIETGY